MNDQIAVLALGNPLRGDDGVGTAVLQALADYPLPPNVTLIDGGTPGLETVLLLKGYQRVLIIDAAEMGMAPGVWRCFTLDDAIWADQDTCLGMLHDAGLAQALALAEALNLLPPQLEIYGVQPDEIGWEAGLK